MRGCLLALVGFVLGIGLMVISWPHIPSGGAPTQSGDITIHVTDRYMTRMVQRRVSVIGVFSVRDVSVASAPPRLLIVRAHTGVGPLSVPVALELQPLVRAGSVQVSLVQVQVASLPVPSFLSSVVAGAINVSLRHALPPAAHVDTINVAPDGVDLIAHST